MKNIHGLTETQIKNMYYKDMFGDYRDRSGRLITEEEVNLRELLNESELKSKSPTKVSSTTKITSTDKDISR